MLRRVTGGPGSGGPSQGVRKELARMGTRETAAEGAYGEGSSLGLTAEGERQGVKQRRNTMISDSGRRTTRKMKSGG